MDLLVLPGCGDFSPVRVAEKSAAERPAWPQAPAPARIQYQRSVSASSDWGITRSLVQRIVDVLVGGKVERFVRPTGVAEWAGVLCVADPGSAAVWIFDAPRNRAIKVAHAGRFEFASPVAVAMRADGSVYVADSVLKKTFLLDREGLLIRIAAQEGLERPAGLAYDSATDLLYVADSVANRIMVFDATGKQIASWGGAGIEDGQFNRPIHIALDASGTLLVTDALNFRIQAFDRSGRFLWKLGHHGDGTGDFAAPKGIASDREGHVYVVDALFDAIQVFNRDGTLLLAFGERGAAAGQFWLPGGLFIGPQDDIYVADAYNARVQVFASRHVDDRGASSER